MGKYLQFDIENAEVIEEPVDSQFATARIQAFSSDRNLHNLVCSEDILKETAPTIYNKPILYTIDKTLQDFYTHVEPDKSLICGFVVPDSAEFVRQEDGRLSLSVLARIWKKYSPRVIELFKRDKNKKRVSVEMEVFQLADRPDGLTDMISFAYAGICLLGDYVREASPGANMQMVSFSEDKQEYEQAYIAEFASRYDELDFKIPEGVKKNAQEGLDLHKKHGRGGTSVALATARHIIKNEFSQPEKIRSLAKHFARHTDDNLENKEGGKWIAWQLWGGNAGLGWSKKLVESMDKIDQRKLAYFQEGGEKGMPYKELKDINPSLKGIEPPISLAQANAIARQADAIGVDKEKNGWAIAISSFKKSHKVEDGKWVEKNKEEQMADEGTINPVEVIEIPPVVPKEFSLNSSQTTELLGGALGEYKYGEDWRKYWVESFDEQYVYISDNEDGKSYRVPYSILENAANVDIEKKEYVIRGGYVLAGSEPIPFSFASFSNLIAYMEEEPEAEEEKIAAEELKKEKANFAAVVGGMYAKMCKMAAKVAEMAEEKVARDAEMSALKEFKASIEAQQKQFAVDETLRELDSRVVISDEARTEMLADAEKYSFAEINIWQNNCKAKSFDFALKAEKSDKSEVKRYAMPFINLPKPANNGSVWPAKTQ